MLSTHLPAILLLLGINTQAQSDVINSLTGLIKQTFHTHPSLQSSQYLQQAAEQGLESAQWHYFPTPSINLSRTSSKNHTFEHNTAQVKLTQTLWSGGRIDANLAQAKAQLKRQEADILLVKTNLALQILQVYRQWHVAHLKRRHLDQANNTYQALKTQLKRRIKQGLSSQSDLLLIHTQLADIRVDIQVNNTQSQNALSQLKHLSNQALEVALQPEIAQHWQLGQDHQLQQQRMLDSHPALAQLQAQVRLSQAQYQSEKGLLSPQLDLSLDRQWRDGSDGDTRAQLELFTRFGPGFSSGSNTNKAWLEYQAAQQDLQAQKQILTQQFDQRWHRHRSLIQQQPLLKEALHSARQTKDSYDRQLSAGRKTWKDVINAMQEVLQLELRIVENEAESVYLSWHLGIDIYGVKAIE